jgi:hypothetical protein
VDQTLDCVSALEAKVDSMHSFVVERQALQASRAEFARARKQESARLERELADKFAQSERARAELERKVSRALEEKVLAVQADVRLETANRAESLGQLRDSLGQDFPQLQALLVEEATERGAQDLATGSAFQGEVERMT